MFIFFSPNRFLNLGNHSSLAVKGLVSLALGAPLLKSSYRLNALWHNVTVNRNKFAVYVST